MWCGVVWCGVVWCGVVWCGVVWCGVVRCGVVQCGVCLAVTPLECLMGHKSILPTKINSRCSSLVPVGVGTAVGVNRRPLFTRPQAVWHHHRGCATTARQGGPRGKGHRPQSTPSAGGRQGSGSPLRMVCAAIWACTVADVSGVYKGAGSSGLHTKTAFGPTPTPHHTAPWWTPCIAFA